MAKVPTTKLKAVPLVQYIDLDTDSANASGRLVALAGLMQSAGESDVTFELENLGALGDLIEEEAKRARAAFDQLREIYLAERAKAAG